MRKEFPDFLQYVYLIPDMTVRVVVSERRNPLPVKWGAWVEKLENDAWKRAGQLHHFGFRGDDAFEWAAHTLLDLSPGKPDEELVVVLEDLR